MRIPVQEKKKYVIKLHKEEYTVRQISERLHISSRDVIQIIKDYEREQEETRKKEVIYKEENEKHRIISSKRSEALKLYKKGTRPLDVAIELEISAEEANAFFQEYCSLQYPPQLLQIYTELHNTNSFNQFIDFFHLVRQKELSTEEAIEAIKMINDFPLLKEQHQDLSEKVTNLKNSYNKLLDDNIFFKDKNEELEKRLNYFSEKNEIAEKKLEDFDKRIIQKEEQISKINSSEDYYKAREKAKLIVEEFLKKDIDIIRLCISTISQIVNENQQKENSGLNIPDSVYEYVLKTSDNEVNRKKLDRVSEKMLDNISEICTDDLLNSSLDT